LLGQLLDLPFGKSPEQQFVFGALEQLLKINRGFGGKFFALFQDQPIFLFGIVEFFAVQVV
jgi:hypothetical protein